MKTNFPWSLTEITCHAGFSFRQAMSYRSGVITIPPTVKEKGISKKKFSRADVGKFLIARRLFDNGLSRIAVQKTLDRLEEWGILPDALESPALCPKALEGVFLVAVPPLSAVSFLNQQLAQKYGEPPIKNGEPLLCSSVIHTPEDFSDLILSVAHHGWQIAMLSLGSIDQELAERVDAIRGNREYRRPSVAGAIVKAFAAVNQEVS